MDSEDNQKHPGGRPLKFKTVAELDQAIRAYFDRCDPHIEERMVDGGINQKGETIWIKREVMTDQKPYLMSGLARALGTTRETLLDYGSGKHDDKDEEAEDDYKFSDSVAAAKARCEEFTEGELFGPYSNGAKFNLINNYQGTYRAWADKHEVDHTSKGKRITSPVIMSAIDSRNVEAETQTEDSN